MADEELIRADAIAKSPPREPGKPKRERGLRAWWRRRRERRKLDPAQRAKRESGSIGRRHSDRKGPRHARDFIIVCALGLALLAIKDDRRTIRQLRTLVIQVQEGRQTGTAIQCSVLSAISEAGRATITGSASGLNPTLVTFLEQHGYPPLRIRQAQANTAGQQYVEAISQRVESAIGHRGDKLVRPDGTLDCGRLAQLSKVQLPR